jgi:hypothetical protein
MALSDPCGHPFLPPGYVYGAVMDKLPKVDSFPPLIRFTAFLPVTPFTVNDTTRRIIFQMAKYGYHLTLLPTRAFPDHTHQTYSFPNVEQHITNYSSNQTQTAPFVNVQSQAYCIGTSCPPQIFFI